MKTMKLAAFLSLVLMLCACIPIDTRPALTPLAIQSIQQREFENNKKTVFYSVVSVFQDLGYTVEAADLETGFITAENLQGGLATKTPWWLPVDDSIISEKTKVTAVVEQIGESDRSRVRLNFTLETKHRPNPSGNATSAPTSSTTVLDADTYINAFEKIETAIFTRS